MKAVDEYKESDLDETLDHACIMSMAVINNIWNENKDEERIDREDICSVEKAMKVLCMYHDMVHKVVAK